MPIKTRISLIALLGLPILAVGPAFGGTLTTNFGANFGNNTAVAKFFNICGGQFCSDAGYATPFTPTANYNVTSVDVLMSFEDGDSPYVEIGIYSNVGNAPGSLIGQLSMLDLAAPTTTGPTINSVFTPDSVVYGDNTATCANTSTPCVYNVPLAGVTGATGLVAGTTYWLAALPATIVGSNPTSGADIMWWRNKVSNSSTWETYALTQDFTTNHPTSPNTTWESSIGNLTNEPAPYFDINGTIVGNSSPPSTSTPEPTTLALLGFGLGAIVLRRRQRSR